MARLLEPFGDDRINQAVSHYQDHYGGVGLFFARPYEGISRLLGGMRNAGQSLFVGTSKLAPFATTVLVHFCLAEHFAGIYGAEADGRFSSKTDLIRHILHERRLDPRATVVVGDREHDVISARANGVEVISVTYGYGTVAELRAAGADVLCDTPSLIYVSWLKVGAHRAPYDNHIWLLLDPDLVIRERLEAIGGDQVVPLEPHAAVPSM